ncbi:MAG TPA: hypothetical protein VF092_09445 [Longimicrobium sp.]
MHIHRARTAGFLLITLLLGGAGSLRAQMAAPSSASWRAEAPVLATQPLAAPAGAFVADTAARRGHTKEGLLIGGIVGVAAAGLFLAGFCDDSDSPCQGDEYARALVYIALPPAVVGALIGTLIRTKN